MPEGNPCLAFVGLSAASFMGVVLPEGAVTATLLLRIASGENHDLWIGPWRHSGAVPCLKVPSRRPLFVGYSFVSS